MMVGIFAIGFGAVMLLIAPRYGSSMAKKFRQFGAEADPNVFKLPMALFGLAAIVFGIVVVTRALL